MEVCLKDIMVEAAEVIVIDGTLLDSYVHLHRHHRLERHFFDPSHLLFIIFG